MKLRDDECVSIKSVLHREIKPNAALITHHSQSNLAAVCHDNICAYDHSYNKVLCYTIKL